MAPTETPVAAAMLCGNLTETLAELDHEIGYGLATEIDACQVEFDLIGDADDLLLHYCSLFILPPRRVKINVGAYLDGTCNGATARALASCYAAGGANHAGEFPDLADHMALQLEFVARLFARAVPGGAPGRFIDRYPASWIAPLIGDIWCAGTDQDFAGKPYLALAILLCKALACDADSKCDALAEVAGKYSLGVPSPLRGTAMNACRACKR